MRRTELLDSINSGNFELRTKGQRDGRSAAELDWMWIWGWIGIEEARGWCRQVGLRFDGAPLFGSSIVGMGFLSYRGKRDIFMRWDRGKRDRAGEALAFSVETRQSRQENQRRCWCVNDSAIFYFVFFGLYR